MRLAALGLLLLAVYAATLSIPATAGERYAGDELHHLLAARSWVEDGDLDLANQYAERQWREFTRPGGADERHARARPPARAAGRRDAAGDLARVRARRRAARSSW